MDCTEPQSPPDQHYRLSASALASHYSLKCERKLILDASNLVPRLDRSPFSSLPTPLNSPSEASKIRGVLFEEDLLYVFTSGRASTLSLSGAHGLLDLSQGVRLKSSMQRQPDAEKDLVATLKALALEPLPPSGSSQPLVFYHEALHHPKPQLWVDPAATLEESENFVASFELAKMEPDFIFARPSGHCWELLVVDTKSSAETKVSMQVQVCLYHMAIQRELEFHGLTKSISMAPLGVVWLPPLRAGGSHRLERFSLQAMVANYQAVYETL